MFYGLKHKDRYLLGVCCGVSLCAEGFMFVRSLDPHNCPLSPRLTFSSEEETESQGGWSLCSEPQGWCVLVLGKPGFARFAMLPREEDHVFIFSRSSGKDISEESPGSTCLWTSAREVGPLSVRVRQGSRHFPGESLMSCFASVPTPTSLFADLHGPPSQRSRRREGPDVPGMARVASGLRVQVGGKCWARSQDTEA